MNTYHITNENNKITCNEGLPITDFSAFLKSLARISMPEEKKNQLMMERVIVKVSKEISKSSLIETDSKTQVSAGGETFYLLDKGDVLTVSSKNDCLSVGVKQDSTILISKEPFTNITLRSELKPEVDKYPEGSIDKQAIFWLENGQRGMSSLTLCYHLTSDTIKEKIETMEKRKNFLDYPHDSSDFGRCHKFFTMVPMARERLNEMANLNTQWASLIKVWDDLEALYINSKESPENLDKIYTIISDVTRPPRNSSHP